MFHCMIISYSDDVWVSSVGSDLLSTGTSHVILESFRLLHSTMIQLKCATLMLIYIWIHTVMSDLLSRGRDNL